MEAGRLLKMLLFLSSKLFISLRSEMTRVVLVNLFRLKIPPYFRDHSVNLEFVQPRRIPTHLSTARLTRNARQQLESDVRSPELELWADLSCTSLIETLK